jgi:cytoskeleton protein RodZ
VTTSTMGEFGELLRQARDEKGVTIREVERVTRIRRQYLAALEAQEFSKLPPAAYARGIVKNYAQYLGLSQQEVLALYERATGTAAETFEIVPATRPMDSRSHWVPNFAIIAFMVVMSGIVFVWMYSAYFRESETLANGTVGVATMTPVSQSILAVTSPQVTVATQGGGFATVTPTNTPAATATTAPAQATETNSPDVVASEPAAVAVEPTETVVEEVPVEPAPEESITEEVVTGAHTFAVWVTEEVWVEVIVDGVVVFNDVLPAGSERSFSGDSVSITSGNSAYVHIYVDGEEYDLGDSWNSTFSYP